MTMVLANASMDSGQSVRLLLCDDAGALATKSGTGNDKKILPMNKTPSELLAGLLRRGALVQVCGIFLPTRGLQADALLPGVSPALPADIAAAIADPAVTTVGF